MGKGGCYNTFAHNFNTTKYTAMQKTMLAKSFLPFLAIVTLSACRKLPVATTAVPGQVYSYFNLPYLNADGRFLFQNNDVINDSALKRNTQISGNFYNTTNMVYSVGGMANIAGYNMQPNSNGQYQLSNLGNDSLYGKIISYSINLPATQGTGVLTGSFYSPAPIYATNIPPMTQVNIPPNSTFPITWGADANNTNSVNIMAEYFPTEQTNSLLAKGDSLFLDNSIMVPDNGSTSLPASFFAKFPTGALLWIFVGRGNAIYVQNGQYVYLLSGFFRSSFFAVKQ
jgi:hypothetical protein